MTSLYTTPLCFPEASTSSWECQSKRDKRKRDNSASGHNGIRFVACSEIKKKKKMKQIRKIGNQIMLGKPSMPPMPPIATSGLMTADLGGRGRAAVATWVWSWGGRGRGRCWGIGGGCSRSCGGGGGGCCCSRPGGVCC